MTERGFWRFVWLAGPRLAFATMPWWHAVPMSLWAVWTLCVARYFGIRPKR